MDSDEAITNTRKQVSFLSKTVSVCNAIIYFWGIAYFSLNLEHKFGGIELFNAHHFIAACGICYTWSNWMNQNGVLLLVELFCFYCAMFFVVFRARLVLVDRGTYGSAATFASTMHAKAASKLIEPLWNVLTLPLYNDVAHASSVLALAESRLFVSFSLQKEACNILCPFDSMYPTSTSSFI